MSEEPGTVAVSGDRWHEALDWYTRWQEAHDAELPHDKIQSWQTWISDDHNRLVFDQVSRLLEDGPRLRRRRVPGSDPPPTDPSESQLNSYEPTSPVSEWQHTRGANQEPTAKHSAAHRSRVRRRFVAFATAAVAIVCGLLLSALPERSRLPIDQMLRQPQFHTTTLGEIQNIHLEDGSTVILGARSAIEVAFSRAHRAVKLVSGEAWFKVAHNPDRPFIVSAGSRTITAVGTAFVVQRDSDRVVVTVTEGSVEVAPQRNGGAANSLLGAFGAKASGAARVARGQQMILLDGAFPRVLEHMESEAATAWSEGRLEFDREPLRYVVETVNRYTGREIALDRVSGEQLYTGLVLKDQVDDWIHGLERIFPVEITEKDTRVCIRSRTEPSTGAACGAASTP